MCFRLFDQARTVIGRGAQSADCFWRNWHDHSHPHDFHDQPLLDRVFLCGRDLYVCGFQHNGECAALGPIQQPIGGVGERAERNEGWNRNDRCIQTHWVLLRRPPGHGRSFFRSDCAYRGAGALRRMIMVLLLVRNTAATNRGLVRRI